MSDSDLPLPLSPVLGVLNWGKLGFQYSLRPVDGGGETERRAFRSVTHFLT